MPDPMSTPIGDGTLGGPGSNAAPFLPYHDLRQWLEEAKKLGEVKELSGLTYQQDIGMVAEMSAHADDAPCFVFEDVPGTLKGSRLLVNFFAGKRKNMTLGFSTELSKLDLSEEFSRQSRRHAQAHPAEIRRVRPGDAERHAGRCDRRHQIPGAAMACAGRRPLYRHRLLQHHARPRRRLDQLRHLSRHDPRREIARLLHLARQARPGDARQICRARRAHAGGHHLRRRSDEFPHGLERSAAGRLRARHHRRHARPSRSR